MMKLIIPCAIVLVLAALPLSLISLSTGNHDIPNILDKLKTSENLQDTVKEFECAISFLSNIPDTQNANHQKQIFEYRYHAGLNLSERKTEEAYRQALKQYQAIHRLNPSYNHGWLQFFIGDIHQKLKQWDDALDAFRKVPLYNHSRLALRVQFLKNLLLINNNQPASSYELYMYLRFASEFPYGDASTITTGNWRDGDYSPYIKALAAFEAENKEAAISLMEEYLANNPNDRSAQYYMNKFKHLDAVNDGSQMIDEFYSKSSILQKECILQEGHSILVDIYITPQPQTQRYLQLNLDALPGTSYQFEYILNQSSPQPLKRTMPPGQYDGNSVGGVLQTNPGRNLLEIRWYNTDSANRNVNQPSAIHLNNIQINPNPSEPQL